MITTLFYMIVAGVSLFQHGPTWLFVLWILVAVVDIAAVPWAIKKGKRKRREREIEKAIVREFEHITRIANHCSEDDSWVKTCVLDAARRIEKKTRKN